MNIAIRNGKDGKWQEMPDGDQLQDGYIRDLIYQLPKLIPIERLGAGGTTLEVCVKRPSLTGSQEDGGLIGIDSEGNITILECKYADDPAFSKQVIGQAVFDAASLSGKSYEELCKILAELQISVTKEKGKPTVKEIKKKQEEIFKSSSTYEEICWLISQMRLIKEKKIGKQKIADFKPPS